MPHPPGPEGDADGLSRRRFLQLMGASLALAGASGCVWEEEKIAPFSVRPIERVPGVPQRYATCLELSGVAQRLLVTSYDGRPIKVEGNPLREPGAPAFTGGTDVFAQASILELYDPDRSRQVVQFGFKGYAITSGWDDFFAFAKPVLDGLRAAGGAGLAVLAEATSSPSVLAQRDALLKDLPKALWFEYEPVSWDGEREGALAYFGAPYRTHYALDRAAVIVSLEADLFGAHPHATQQAHDFSAGRRPEGGRMNRLYVVESAYSLTGAQADHRLPLRAGQVLPFLEALRAEVLSRAGGEGAPRAEAGQVGAGLRAAPTEEHAARFVRALAADLLNARGRGVVAVGAGQPPPAHALAHDLNRLLGNTGQTVQYTLDADRERPSHSEAIRALTKNLHEGRVNTLLILGGNPVYDAPVELGFPAALARAEHRIHLSLYEDETSRACTWHLPRAHYLETWGDMRAYDGTVCTQQPLIEPLYGGQSALELLADLRGDESLKGYDLVRRTFRQFVKEGDFEKAWRQAVHDGFLPGTRWPVESLRALPDWQPPPATPPSAGAAPPNGQLELVFRPDPKVHDGRFANNGWLQELPDFLTKLTWDNAALLSPATAQTLGVESETLVRLKYQGRELEIAAFVLPGLPTGTVVVNLGYGRTRAGSVGGHGERGVAPVGANAYRLRGSEALHFGTGLAVEPTGKPYPLATTEDHHAMNDALLEARQERIRTLVREGTLEEYRRNPGFVRNLGNAAPLLSLWKEHPYPGHRWGMSIDLSLCTGCNACVVACQAENNIPVVGKEQVGRGREMHWLRVDRYFTGPAGAPRVARQPVPCQQCEMAPCEQVCPFGATVHDGEGLNAMVYNRCGGTRYCSNNCPYKVRRFNFFNYQKAVEDDPRQEVRKMAHNPEVTVRSRGVMEKCSYCVQRINAVKIQARNERRPIRDGEIVPACAQACPVRAITFGDLNDPASAVLRGQANPRAYAMLAELNVRPRTVYLARVRNPNPELVGAADDA